MRPAHQRRSSRASALFIKAVLIVAVASSASASGNLLFADNLAAAPDVAEIRVVDGPENAAIEQELRSADHALLQAIATNDHLAASRLLSPEFIWIDRDGRSRSKSDVVSRMVLLSAGPDANITLQNYGRVALLTGAHRLMPDNAPALFARVWIRQPSGWRLLLYQETAAADFSVKDARYGVSRAQWPPPCDNPCRSLPYKPLSSEAQEIVASFMAGEKASFEGDVDTASRILGDDVLFVVPDRAQPIGKAQRLASLRNFGPAGQADPPPTVASMALWTFGSAAVMSADQESASGELLRTTRIWARRAGQWQLTFSQQTLVQ